MHLLYGREDGSRGVGDPLDGLILTVLSQNTSDTNSARAFLGLKESLPGWEEVLEAGEEVIEEAIRPGGIAHIRARRIKQILSVIAERLGGLDLAQLGGWSTDELLGFFTSLPGVGMKTASVVLLFYYGRPLFPVDTHIHRIASRLGWIPQKAGSEKAHAILNAAIPDEMKMSFHLDLIAHGREICKPSRPRCGDCAIRAFCARVGVGPSSVKGAGGPSDKSADGAKRAMAHRGGISG